MLIAQYCFIFVSIWNGAFSIFITVYQTVHHPDQFIGFCKKKKKKRIKVPNSNHVSEEEGWGKSCSFLWVFVSYYQSVFFYLCWRINNRLFYFSLQNRIESDFCLMLSDMESKCVHVSNKIITLPKERGCAKLEIFNWLISQRWLLSVSSFFLLIWISQGFLFSVVDFFFVLDIMGHFYLFIFLTMLQLDHVYGRNTCELHKSHLSFLWSHARLFLTVDG